MNLLGFVLFVGFAVSALAGCGCLKCSKHLRVVSPPTAPVQVIYRDGPDCHCPRYIPYAVQQPVRPVIRPCTLRTVDYKVDSLGPLSGDKYQPCPKHYQYAYQVQKPVVTPTTCPELICGLVARTDRIIVPGINPKVCAYKPPAVPSKVIYEPYPCDEDDDFTIPIGYEAIRPVQYDRYLPDDCNVPIISRSKRSINFDNLIKNNRGSGISDEFINLDDIERSLSKSGKNVFVKPDLGEKNIISPKGVVLKNKKDYQKLPIDQIRNAVHSISTNSKTIMDRGGKYKSTLSKKLSEDSNTLLNKLKNNKAKHALDNTNNYQCSKQQPIINIHNLHIHNEEKSNLNDVRKKLIVAPTSKRSSLKPQSQIQKQQRPFRIGKLFKKEEASNNEYQPLSVKKSWRATKKKSKPNKGNTQRSLWLDHVNSQDVSKGAYSTPLKRHKRALFMKEDSFYRVTEEDSGQVFDEDDVFNDLIAVKDEDGDGSLENGLIQAIEQSDDSFEEILEQSKTSNGPKIDDDAILPLQTPFIYFVKFPLNILNHFHELKKHFSPILQTVPNVIKKSTNYLNNFNSKIKRHALDFVSTIIGDFDDDQREIDLNSYFRRTKRHLNPPRNKRELLKLLDEEELQDFLREKLSVYQDDEIIIHPKEVKRKLRIEKVDPKIIVDRNGRTFLDIDGIKSPILDFNKKIMRLSKERFAKSRGKATMGIDDYNLHNSISELIAQAKNIVGQPNIDVAHYDIERSKQSIKDKINDVLVNIQKLIHADFGEDAKIFGPILDLQNRQLAIGDVWKKSLINLKHNEIGEKIKILNGIQDIQKLKGEIVSNIIRVLSEGRNYYSNKFIKVLLRLQKLQCVLIKVVEEFGERIKLGTKFDVQNEIRYIETLSKIHYTEHDQLIDIAEEMKVERNAKLEADMKLIEQLRQMLEENKEDRIEEEAKLLWELRNIEKLQINSLNEVRDNIIKGLTIRRELKILFDLEKQLEKCNGEQRELLDKNKESKIKPDFAKEKVTGLKPGKFKKFQFKLNLPINKKLTTKKPHKKKSSDTGNS